MKIRIRRRFPIADLMFTVALICISSYAFLEHTTISIVAFSALKLPLLYMGAICILSQSNLLLSTFLKRKYFFVWMLVLSLCLVLMISMYVNRRPLVGSIPIRTTVRQVLYLWELFALMIWAAERGESQFVISFVYMYLLILTIVTDFLLLTKIIVFRNGSHESYLVGTKFSVSYLHMNLVAFWALRNRSENTYRITKINVFLAIALVGISLYINCLTGVLGATAMLVFMHWCRSKRTQKILRLTSPNVLTIALIGNVVFAFTARQIMTIPVVAFFVSSVLGRSTTLTGRISIFEMFGDKINFFWVWGCGVGNEHAAASWLFGYDNAQNAFLQWLLQAGIVATVLLCGLMLFIFRQLSRSNKQEKVLPLVVLVYVYIIMGMVETTFNMSFIMWLAVIFMLVNEKQKTVDIEKN